MGRFHTFQLYLAVWTAFDLALEGYELEAIRYLTGREGSSPVVFADVHEEVHHGQHGHRSSAALLMLVLQERCRTKEDPSVTRTIRTAGFGAELK